MPLLFGLICRRLVRAGKCAGGYCFVAPFATQMHRSSWRSQMAHHLNCTWVPGLFKAANRSSMSGQVHFAIWLLQITQNIKHAHSSAIIARSARIQTQGATA
jgi:hypothetical protein